MCALVHYYLPNDLDLDKVKTDTKEDILQNHKMAFDLAEKNGVVSLLDPGKSNLYI